MSYVQCTIQMKYIDWYIIWTAVIWAYGNILF